MEETRRSERVKNMICFIPFFFIIISIVEKNKTPRIRKNMLYAEILIALFIVFWILFAILPLGGFLLPGFLYLGFSGYLGYKAWIGDDYDIEFIDKIFFKK